jgi:precorrin-6B C5,15-methyltransferase / cobalt-precorrin-6B C5,C15-methyltransferase
VIDPPAIGTPTIENPAIGPAAIEPPTIEVVGLTARGWADLPEPQRAVVRSAPLVLGGPRLLALVPLRSDQRALELPRPLHSGLRGLLGDEPCAVVLASGDPLLSGIGTTLLGEFGPERVRIHPAVSSVALARARMGWSAESAVTLSLVARPIDRIRRALAPNARLVLLSSDHQTPASVAHVLVDAGYGDSHLTVLGDLGGDLETRMSAAAREWTMDAPRLNVLCVECVPDQGVPTYGWTCGLPDQAYEHDGQLTRRDVRAAVLARLAPRPGELLWDLGAGAGSVAIEWSRADPACRAVAVERDPHRADRISRNAGRLGVPDLRVIAADTADQTVIEQLPPPSAIFVGGGASETLIEMCWSALPAGGRLVIAAVTVETEQLVLAAAGRRGGELTKISTEQLGMLGRFHGWVPARSVVLWVGIKDGPAEHEPR